MRVEAGARRDVARQPAFARDASTCATIAERQGGGGHRFAAGFTSDESAEAVVAQILDAAVTRRASARVRDGLVVVDKAPGWTSHDVVAKLRGVYGQKRVGHAGTLDPDATGVLLVGLGRVTRLLRYLQEAGKEYRGRVVFGVATDTLDASGAVLERTEMPITRDELDAAARAFVGDIEQVPPMVSALKVGGRRLYEMARAGEEVERAARPVRIDELVVEEFEPGAYPEATDGRRYRRDGILPGS